MKNYVISLVMLLLFSTISVGGFSQAASQSAVNVNVEAPTDVVEALEAFAIKGLEWVEEAGEFVVEQAPLVVQEFIVWKTVMHSIWGTVGFIGFVLCGIWTYNIRATIDDHPGTIGTGLISVAGLVVFIVHGMLLIKLTVAPKLYLIDYFFKSSGC